MNTANGILPPGQALAIPPSRQPTDGNPLAAGPDRIRRATAEISARHPGADPEDVLPWAGARAAVSMSHLVLPDNEAIRALASPAHPRHPHAVSHVQAAASRKRQAMTINVTAPTAIRAQAGWNRSPPARALINRLPVTDIPLDAAHADTAVGIRSGMQVPAAGAHIGAVIQAIPADRITVITSDPADMRRAAGDKDVTIVKI